MLRLQSKVFSVWGPVLTQWFVTKEKNQFDWALGLILMTMTMKLLALSIVEGMKSCPRITGHLLEYPARPGISGHTLECLWSIPQCPWGSNNICTWIQSSWTNNTHSYALFCSGFYFWQTRYLDHRLISLRGEKEKRKREPPPFSSLPPSKIPESRFAGYRLIQEVVLCFHSLFSISLEARPLLLGLPM